MFDRTEAWWELRNLSDPPERRQGGGEKNVLVLELDGEPAGYALYRVFSKFEFGSSAGHVEVIEALADGAVATRELWRVLLDMDWLATLKAFLLPIDHPLLQQLRYPRRLQMRIGDGLWVRLVDVGAALSARAYGGEGPVVFEVEDAFLPENTGRWKIAGGTAETDGRSRRSRPRREGARRRLPRRVHVRRAAPGGHRARAEGGRCGSCRRSVPDERAQTVVSGDLLTGLLPSRAECWGPFSARPARCSSA